MRSFMRSKGDMMKIGIYDPYLQILGGGEKYIATIAKVLETKYEIDLFSDDDSIIEKIKDRFNIGLNTISLIPANIFKKRSSFEKLSNLKRYDIFIYVTDGSLFFSGAKKNFLLIQSPAHLPTKKLINNFKLRNWKIICYSSFMARIIKDRLDSESYILPPSVEETNKSYLPKKNIILSVGRFFLYPHNKKQEVLIDVFKENYSGSFKGYKFILAGGLTEESGTSYLAMLKKNAFGFPIEFKVNIGFDELAFLYKNAKIYWHAAGFGEDLAAHPERAEHFGISTLEAMNRKCVPVVFAGGGQPEIVSSGQTGFLWTTKSDLAGKTSELIINEKLRKKLANGAYHKSLEFTEEKFYEKLKRIIF